MSYQDFKINHLTCRTFGHTWKPQTVTVTKSASGRVAEYRAGLTCTRCKTERVQVFDGSGELVSNSYLYPSGYLRPMFGGQRFRKSQARLEYALRVMEEESDG